MLNEKFSKISQNKIFSFYNFLKVVYIISPRFL